MRVVGFVFAAVIKFADVKSVAGYVDRITADAGVVIVIAERRVAVRLEGGSEFY